MSSAVSHAAFVPRSGETWRDPFGMYAALREHDPVHHVADGDYWVLTRHRDVLAAVRDHETFSSAQGLTTEYGELERIGLADNPPMVMTDPPVHTEFRRLVSRGFTPRQVESVEPTVRAFVVERLDRLLAAGGGDIVADLFKPLPSMVVAHYLGVPEEDRARFDAWTDAIVAANATATYDGVADAVGELMGYFTELIERRRHEPGDDTVSHLVAAGVAGDDAGLLSVLAFTFTMVTGGNDTSTGLLGGAVQLLSERPDQRALARHDLPATRRGAAPADLPRPGPGADDDPRRHRRRHVDPRRPQGAALLRRSEPGPGRLRAERRRARRHARPAHDPHLRPRCAPLPRRCGGPDDGPRRAR